MNQHKEKEVAKRYSATRELIADEKEKDPKSKRIATLEAILKTLDDQMTALREINTSAEKFKHAVIRERVARKKL